MFKNNIVVDF